MILDQNKDLYMIEFNFEISKITGFKQEKIDVKDNANSMIIFNKSKVFSTS